MAKLKGTKTGKNLMSAFAGESQARNRYTYFASKAKQEGFVQIQLIFEETAHHEQEHAKRFFKFMEGGEEAVGGTYPWGVIGSTAENLKEAAAGEHHENSELYPQFAKEAREEGFEEIAKCFEAVIVSEKQHEKRFLALLDNVKQEQVFNRESPQVWRCLNCGYLHTGTDAPETCAACAHPKSHFELLGENW